MIRKATIIPVNCCIIRETSLYPVNDAARGLGVRVLRRVVLCLVYVEPQHIQGSFQRGSVLDSIHEAVVDPEGNWIPCIKRGRSDLSEVGLLARMKLAYSRGT